MKKIIKFDQECRESLMRGIDTLADAVASTLGPKGRNVVVKHSYDVPFSTHDGVTVAKEVFLNDPVEQAGAELIREAATKTNDLAGDGTTTATVLARAIIREGLKAIDAGANPQLLKQQLEKSAEKVLNRLKGMAKPIKTPEELLQVATISASSDELGRIAAEAVQKAGPDGVITLNEVPATDITIEPTSGLEIENGWMSPYFVTDDQNQAAIAAPYILVTSEKVYVADLIKILDKLPKKDLVVFCEDLEPEALQLLVMNKLDPKSGCHFLAVRAPAYGTRRLELLEDLAVITGATLISKEAGRDLSSVDLDDLGQAERVQSSQVSTLVINGAGHPKDIEARKNQLKKELEASKELFDKDLLTKRIAKLASGVVIINVGGKTILEMREKKYRIEDAVNATQAAQAEGIVPGGETALYQASKVLDETELLKTCLREPLLQLQQNAGLEKIVKDIEPEDYGVDVMDGQIKNLVTEGIVDPVKVTKSALQNAVSIASNVLTTQVVIVDVPEETK